LEWQAEVGTAFAKPLSIGAPTIARPRVMLVGVYDRGCIGVNNQEMGLCRRQIKLRAEPGMNKT
jgi:hypothetical protein